MAVIAAIRQNLPSMEDILSYAEGIVYPWTGTVSMRSSASGTEPAPT